MIRHLVAKDLYLYRWMIAGCTVAGVASLLVTSLPGVAEHIQGPVVVWSPTILAILGIEVSVSLLALGLAFYVQSRRKDFI